MKWFLVLTYSFVALSFSSSGQVTTPHAGLAQMSLERTMPTAIHDLKSEINQFSHLSVTTNYRNYHPEIRLVFLEGIRIVCSTSIHWSAIETVEIQANGTPAQYGEVPNRPNASSWPFPESYSQPINDLRFLDADPAYTRRGHEGT